MGFLKKIVFFVFLFSLCFPFFGSFGCSTGQASLSEIKVLEAAGSGYLKVSISEQEMSIHLDAMRDEGYLCQRYRLKIGDQEAIGYAPGSDPECGPSQGLQIDWSFWLDLGLRALDKLI